MVCIRDGEVIVQMVVYSLFKAPGVDAVDEGGDTCVFTTDDDDTHCNLQNLNHEGTKTRRKIQNVGLARSGRAVRAVVYGGMVGWEIKNAGRMTGVIDSCQA